MNRYHVLVGEVYIKTVIAIADSPEAAIEQVKVNLQEQGELRGIALDHNATYDPVTWQAVEVK